MHCGARAISCGQRRRLGVERVIETVPTPETNVTGSVYVGGVEFGLFAGPEKVIVCVPL